MLPLALQAVTIATIEDFARWSTTVLAAIGAPSAEDLAAIAPAHQAALTALTDLRRSIQIQSEQAR